MSRAVRINAVFLACIVAASAQVSSNVALSNGVQLTIVARAEEGTPVALKASLEPATGESFYRIFRDENNLAVFAYELTVSRTPDGQQFRVTAKAATQDFATRFPNADGGKPTPTLSAPLESPLLSSGNKFVIPISTDPGLHQTLTDTVQIRLNQRGVATTGAGADTNEQIRFSALKVSINNQSASAGGSGAVVSGRFAMFYIPGRGGFFFSTEEVTQPAFQQIGVVDGKHLKFTVDNVAYDCLSDAPILVHSDRGQLWVYHDADYKPRGNWTNSDPASSRAEFFTASADSIQWWLQ